jgi:hypothetical protein
LQSPYEPVTAGLVERQGDDHRQQDLVVESGVVIGSMSPGSDSCKNTSRSLREVAADEIDLWFHATKFATLRHTFISAKFTWARSD